MFKFLGIQHINFTPEGKSEPIQGYKAHFSDDTIVDNCVGMLSFTVFFSYDKANSVLGIRSPMEIGRYAERVDKPCEIAFDRKGKVTGISFNGVSVARPAPPVLPVDDDPFTPAKSDTTTNSPKKL